MNKYRLPISLIFSFEAPVFRLRHEIGVNGPGVPAHDGLERKLHGEVEVGGKDGATSADDLAPVGLEGVGGVVEWNPEQDLDEESSPSGSRAASVRG